MTTTKFSIGDRVITNDFSVGIISNIDIDIDETEYEVKFIDNNYEDFKEEEIKSTKLELTTILGVSETQYLKEKEEERIEQEKKDKAYKIINEIKAIKNRYAGKCKDGKTFWKLYNEDVANLISMEITGEKYENNFSASEFWKYYGGLPVYIRGFNK